MNDALKITHKNSTFSNMPHKKGILHTLAVARRDLSISLLNHTLYRTGVMKIFTCVRISALFVVFLGTAAADAEDISPTLDVSSTLRVEASEVKSCTFVTHDCELCIRSDDDRISCSSVGFACQPTVWRCLTSNR